MSPPSSAKLIAALVDQHGAALALYASQWTDEPDDCVQESLMELARQRETPDSPLSWMYRVVKRRALNAVRATTRRRGREREAFRRRLSAAPGAPDPAATSALADAVAQLDDSSREAIVLRAWGGLTFAELGQALGVSTATAARRYDDGIAKLRNVWAPDEPTPLKPTEVR